MGPFPSSFGNMYILLAMDYVSKWVEAIACPRNDAITVVGLIQRNILSIFGAPKTFISDEGSHFANKVFAKLMSRYGIKHLIGLAYCPQSNGQAEISNREIKKILEKIVSANRKDWSINWMMHCGPIELLTKLPLECTHTELYMENLVISP